MQTLPTLPPHTALFLDFDGTLVALADQPEQVVVPPELLPLLVHLQTRLGGALALVSGRRLQDLDQFLAPLHLPAAAEHGAIRRTAQGDVYSAPTPHLSAIEMAMQSLVSQHPGLRLEPKQTSLALHYRHAPALAALCHDTLVTALHGRPDLTLLHGKCVLEVKPAHIGKGQAIAILKQATSAARMQTAQMQTAKAGTAASGSIRFLPIIGAPVQAVTPLSRQLGAEARANGLTNASA